MLEQAYQVGGSLAPNSAVYISRQADQKLSEALLVGEFCYVFNARQMGKSTLRVATMARLQRLGIKCHSIDLSKLGTQHITMDQWYAAIAADLVKGFQLSIDLREWWNEHQNLSPIDRLATLIETVLLKEISENVVLFFDETESISRLNFPTDDFFSLINTCYQRRISNPDYRRLNFALFGVASPPALVTGQSLHLFALGQAVNLKNFTPSQAKQLADGLAKWVPNSQEILQRVMYWTEGQPFLTQKLCQLIIDSVNRESIGDSVPTNYWVDCLVQRRIIDNWEWQDNPEHLRTIRDRLLNTYPNDSSLLILYRCILLSEQPGYPFIKADNSELQQSLILTGLVNISNGILKVKNRIYRGVFDLEWVRSQIKPI